MLGFLKKTVNLIKDIAPSSKERLEKEVLEEILLECDVAYECIEKLLGELPNKITKEQLRSNMMSLFDGLNEEKEFVSPKIELIIGVNGAGKTTTIAKLASMYKSSDKSVLLGASDTFRAAAIEQLKLWGQKLDINVIASQKGHDPSSVAYDTISSAMAKNIDNVIIDTAGRLHNQKNLALELEKIKRVCTKAKPDSPDNTILILDGTQGNSAIAQAKAFNEIAKIDSIIITKLDGTAKGGAILSIVDELKIPITYIGVGEKESNLVKFDKTEYIDTILNSIYGE
ncbi:MAG: Signal recognition particle receptor protein FtsY (=alpha subunit) (TC 3.A.5.1.1) [uncultured Campylobacterales bacterium]|uniref:Signal recognition particle receptor protein FtsY (=alpha subunit) (TC 3.A.5.1.1) n=1 Tax=uncultured Campylobacterales bacterium TaxID=352960 RepID=A0A6S6SBM5_9BACT|nr:MAG: Signal recognition particle receptor protein FtsY (=alpha subunit) (TC 3.A.5.1.1) [uncultured Campylobacterales bacterium]